MKKNISEKQRLFGTEDFIILDCDVYRSKPSTLDCITYLECLDIKNNITYIIAKNNTSGKFDVIFNGKVVKLPIFGILSLETAYEILYSYYKGSKNKVKSIIEQTIYVDKRVSETRDNIDTIEIYNAHKYKIDSSLQGLSDRLYKKLQIEIFRINRGQTSMEEIMKAIMQNKSLLNNEYNILIASFVKGKINKFKFKLAEPMSLKATHFILIRRTYNKDKNVIITLK